MCVFYFYLAKFEERRMLSRHPDYAAYMRRGQPCLFPATPGASCSTCCLDGCQAGNWPKLMAVLSIVTPCLCQRVRPKKPCNRQHLRSGVDQSEHFGDFDLSRMTRAYLRDAVTKAIADETVRNALDRAGKREFHGPYTAEELRNAGKVRVH